VKRSPMPKRASAMKRTKVLTQRITKTKRAKVTAAERNARKIVRERSQDHCEIGLNCRATEVHHRMNRSQGGSWKPSNLLHLCAAHHSHVTTHPQAAREQGWAVASHQDPANTPVWLAGRGFAFLADDGDINESEEAA
jgi:hypothetical protein